ncbi:MAG: hypothetical protein ACI9QL_004208 [Candidatus Omnitrophota bacterium]|jgi:hypothetical protein
MADPDAGAEDWLELYNPTMNDVDLAGWYLSDYLNLPFDFIVPDGGYVVPAQGFLYVLADNLPALNQPPDPLLHAAFKLSAAGESIVLCTPDRTRTDAVSFGVQVEGFASGRTPDGGEVIGLLLIPTAGESNAGAPRLPVISVRENELILSALETNYYYAIQIATNLQAAAWETWLGERSATNAVWRFPVPSSDQRHYFRGARRP